MKEKLDNEVLAKAKKFADEHNIKLEELIKIALLEKINKIGE